MAYTREQLRNAQRVIAVGQKMKVPWKLQLAALETILVESGARNVRYGDRDSLGLFQQRPSQGWGSPSQVLDVEHAARTFFTRALQKGPNQYNRAGTLAQAVQVSAYPARYNERKYDAIRLFRQATGSSSKNPVVLTPSRGGSRSGSPSQPVRSPQSQFDPGPGVGAALSQLLSQYYANRPKNVAPVTTEINLPQSANPLSFQPISTWSPPQARNEGLSELLASLSSLSSVSSSNPAPSAAQSSQPASTPRGRARTASGASPRTVRGRVAVASGADRSGVSIHQRVLSFLDRASALGNVPIRVTTGSNHNQYVAGTNRQSDHWVGNAADIAIGTNMGLGDRIAASALQAAGVSRARARQLARRGGVFNFNVGGRRVQILWRTNVGGNHFNHVHVGVR